ncbi:hypothetical protein LZ554_006441 [Drepanopeziza brunnea f. sp. 'monogermtubi']|nr:hypothetical protein LZ554_006441 [Drepanopeziza brunnea f. sp. 'monogermtubi']
MDQRTPNGFVHPWDGNVADGKSLIYREVRRCVAPSPIPSDPSYPTTTTTYPHSQLDLGNRFIFPRRFVARTGISYGNRFTPRSPFSKQPPTTAVLDHCARGPIVELSLTPQDRVETPT